jgi:hypothetical protein
MARVYLETSFVSACVTTRSDAASVYRRETSTEWMRTQASRHELVCSAEVVAELSHPSYPSRDRALALLAPVTMIELDSRVRGFATILVNERVMPGPVGGDAVHVAAASVGRADYLLTWNVRHLANPNKLVHLQRVCLRVGLIAPSIITPDLLWEASS